MAGAAIGEFISHKTFGSPKNRFVLVADIIFFVFIVSAVTTYLQPKEIDLVYYATNFFIGFLAIPIIRGVESLLGLTQKARFSKNESIEIIDTLSHTGMDKEEIENLMHKLGYSKKEVGKYDKFIEKTVPKYLPKFTRMENMLEDIGKRLEKIEKKRDR